MIEIDGEKYYTPKEIAEKFNVHMSTIARWRQSGQLKGYRLNQRKFLYTEKQITAFIKDK